MKNKDLQEVADILVKDIKKSLKDQGLNASGALSGSLSGKGSDDSILISGFLRFFTVIYGRAGGKAPPIDSLKKWVKIRMPEITDENEVTSVAIRIAKKIAREGTNIFSGKAKGLEVDIILDRFHEDLRDKVVTFEAIKLFDDIENLLNGD